VRKLTILVATALLLAMTVAFSGVAQAQGRADVCLSKNGTTIVQKGTSGCISDSTSQALAVNGSSALALNDSDAKAINGSEAVAPTNNGDATAINFSCAGAPANTTVRAVNGEVVGIQFCT
jgi:hypothetical protein